MRIAGANQPHSALRRVPPKGAKRMLVSEIKKLVASDAVPDHLRGLWDCQMETQLVFGDESKYRLPRDGNEQPHYHDHEYHPPFDSLTEFGVSGWDWIDQVTRFVTIDLDSIANHAGGHDQQFLDALVDRLSHIDAVEIVRSKSGRGYHLRCYFNPEHRPKATTRKAHIHHATNLVAWLSAQTGEPLPDVADAVGVMAWIFHHQRGENGLELIKRSTAFVPDDWYTPKIVTEPEADYDALTERLPRTPKHDELIAWLEKHGYGEWKDERLRTHTYAMLLAAEDKSLNIVGNFTTLATGKKGETDRNCFCFPSEGGSWKVVRDGRGTKEHSTWWKSANGYTVTWFNRSTKQSQTSVPSKLVALAKADELFHDPLGNPYVTATVNGIKETYSVSDSRYKYALRLRYTAETGLVAGTDQLKTALEQIKAEAVHNRPEFTVAVRLAAVGDSLYIDLANKERQVVEVTRTGYRLVADAPVRFMRSFGQLPLPIPLAGGSVNDIRRLVNVEEDDLPLLLALMVGALHPQGPYAVGQIVGEKGTAKTSLSRFIHDFVDPHIAVGNVLPDNAKDLLVVAKSRWLLSFDNISSLKKTTSDLLAMLVTGSAISTRKLFSDDEFASVQAKRPVILTAIANVIEASDLLDRTLTLVLPVIPQERRRTEFALNQEMMQEGVRGRIFGYLLSGVVSALANHSTVKLPFTPRMSDFVTWATAAEPGLGLKSGTILSAFLRVQGEQSEQVTDTPFAQKVLAICENGFKGTATELAKRLANGMSGQKASNELREIAPDLRKSGCRVEFRKSNGKNVIELSA